MSNTTRLIDKLLKKELVTRNTCPSNRRKIEIFITEKGSNLLEELDPITYQNSLDITKNLNTTELETLNNLLDKLRA
jgi:DNA-binding MarR family transcriptional regulator